MKISWKNYCIYSRPLPSQNTWTNLRPFSTKLMDSQMKCYLVSSSTVWNRKSKMNSNWTGHRESIQKLPSSAHQIWNSIENPTQIVNHVSNIIYRGKKEYTTKRLCFIYDEQYLVSHRCKGNLFRMDVIGIVWSKRWTLRRINQIPMKVMEAAWR